MKVRADEPETARVDPNLMNDLRHSLKTFSIYGAVWAKAKPVGLSTAQRIELPEETSAGGITFAAHLFDDGALVFERQIGAQTSYLGPYRRPK